jgi:hypothetical protein
MREASMMPDMRTTPTLDDDIAALLKQRARAADCSPCVNFFIPSPITRGPNPSCGWFGDRIDDVLSLPTLTTNIKRVRHGC